MASITKKENGSYIVTVNLGRDKNGKRVREYTSYTPVAKTPARVKKEVEEFARKYEQDVKTRNSFDGNKVTFSNYYENKWKPWAVNHISLRTMEDYTTCIESRGIPAFGDMTMLSVKTGHVRQIVTEMENKKLSPARQRKVISAINSIFTLAVVDGLIEYNPVEVARKTIAKDTETKKGNHFSVDEAVKFLAFIDEPYTIIHKASKQVRNGETVNIGEYKEMRSVSNMWRSYFNLAVYGGFRRGEQLALTWHDINFDDSTIDVNKAVSRTKAKGDIIKGTKSASGNRVVKLPEKVMNILREWKIEEMQKSMVLGSAWEGFRGSQFDDNRLFITACGSPMGTDSPYECFKSICERYNATHDVPLPSISLHGLRHTSASLLVYAGLDCASLSKRLGHADSVTSLRYYVDSDKSSDEKACNLLEKCLG